MDFVIGFGFVWRDRDGFVGEIGLDFVNWFGEIEMDLVGEIGMGFWWGNLLVLLRVRRAWVRFALFVLEFAEGFVGLPVDAVKTGLVAGNQVQGAGVVG